MKVDLAWDDDHVVPPNFTPDLVFLFDRMIQAAVDKIDPARGKISSVSPIGKAVIGRGQGEVVEVTAPAGKLRYQIEQIGR